jgi:hypothetical protein
MRAASLVAKEQLDPLFQKRADKMFFLHERDKALAARYAGDDLAEVQIDKKVGRGKRLLRNAVGDALKEGC